MGDKDDPLIFHGYRMSGCLECGSELNTKRDRFCTPQCRKIHTTKAVNLRQKKARPPARIISGRFQAHHVG
jgi:hypothetical protein